MKHRFRFGEIAILAATTLLGLSFESVGAGPRPHVYLFRGLADIFSAGMDTLTEELKKSGVYATSHSHTNWKAIADSAAADYKAKKEGPIILVGHSLGADAVMEMANYLGDKGVPVALVVPFDGTQSFSVSANVARVINFTQRDYAYMKPGPGFHGSLNNVDVSSNRDIGHLNIDKSPELHARVVSEVLAIIGGHRLPAPAVTKPGSISPLEQGRSQGSLTASPAREPDVGRLPPAALPRMHSLKGVANSKAWSSRHQHGRRQTRSHRRHPSIRRRYPIELLRRSRPAALGGSQADNGVAMTRIFVVAV